jgi:drug/metabolite transporter (DMT)-like permease
MLQAAIRSSVVAVLLVVWARVRGIALFDRDGTLGPGILTGVLFTLEFFFLFAGLAHTTAARMIVFYYCAPVVTALGAHWLLPAERLVPRQWLGVLLGLAGVGVAFSDAFGANAVANANTWIGDLCGVLAGVTWGAKTVFVRAGRLLSISATKTLFYQMAVSTLPFFFVAPLFGPMALGPLTPVVWGALLFQSVVVGFLSYLGWFWLLARYPAGRLAVFSFLAPIIGVPAGGLILGEPLTPWLLAGAALVAAGIALVNLQTGVRRADAAAVGRAAS